MNGRASAFGSNGGLRLGGSRITASIRATAAILTGPAFGDMEGVDIFTAVIA
jgi:hypothetical protein